MKCPYSENYRCWVQKVMERSEICPLNDVSFMESVELWALTGRTPRSIGLDKFLECSPGTNNADDWGQVIKSEMATCFENPTMILSVILTQELIKKQKTNQRIEDWDQECGKVFMNVWTCKDMISGAKKWDKKLKDWRWENKYKQCKR